MNDDDRVIRREVLLPVPRAEAWEALCDRESLEWWLGEDAAFNGPMLVAA